MLLLKWLQRLNPTEILNRLRRHLPWRSLTVVLVVAVVIGAFIIFPHFFWPGGFGFSKGESVATKTVESMGKNAQGQITKTVETTKFDDGKTLWDWLSVLGVPFTLLILGYGLQQAQQKRADKLAEVQRELAAYETKEDVLQAYFDRLSVLLVDKNFLAIAAKVNAKESERTESQPKISATAEERELLDSAVNFIRARTLSILRRFENDPERKTSVIRFLIEADIVSKLKLNLSSADLSGAKLSEANLNFANLSNDKLSGADLSNAKLSEANLSGAKLIFANLIFANLSNANLSEANLSNAILNFANLSNAKLSGADLSNAILIGANLSGVKLNHADLRNANLSGANLSGAKLIGANLSGANLSKAKLIEANLSGAKLSGVDLNHADLRNANLSGAKLSGTDLRNADLSGADLNYADLSGASLTTDQLKYTKLCQTTLPLGITLNPNRDCTPLEMPEK